jgi:hypothetical protein
MAITNVPKINGPSFGGVIYGLSLSVGYAQEPSKLTLDIVNKNGIYETPSLNSIVRITFGSFSFSGRIWSYNIKQTAEEKVLQVTIIDNSVILDRHYILLWKRGLFGRNGSLRNITRTYDFSDESIIVPIKNTRTGFPYTEFVQKPLGRVNVTRSSRDGNNGRIGNVFLLGDEKFANSECEIPDTWYSFNDLKGAVGGIINGNFPSNANFKSTHDGTLRSVLASWGSDLGFDFYWDFDNNQIVFYDVNRGISTSLPNSTSSNIISKDIGATMEGTFRQYGIAYTAMPKSAIKTLSASRNLTVLYTVRPFSINYFAMRVGITQNLGVLRSGWGAGRSESSFLHSAFLGYISRSLRDLFCLGNGDWEVLGYANQGISINKPAMISYLKKSGFQDMIEDLESFDATGLPNYNMVFVAHDPTLADRWHETEQKLLQYQGKWYRIPDKSGSFFYCNPTYTIEVDISVDPEGQTQEDNSEDFAGQRMYDRGGQMSHDETSAQEALGYEQLTSEIQNCAPIHINLKEAGILDGLINARLLSASLLESVNTLVIYPNSTRFVTNKIGFRSSLGRGNNPLETTYFEQKNQNIQNGKRNCARYDETLSRGSCSSAEEEARKIAIKRAGGTVDADLSEDDYVSGLVNKSSRHCNINLRGGNVRVHGPSDAAIQVVCRYSVNINKLSTYGTSQYIWSVGNPGGAGDVAEIRIANENVTDASEDTFQSGRKSEISRPRDCYVTNPRRTIKYVFAGEPQGVSLDVNSGLVNLDVTLSADGFTTTAVFANRTPRPSKARDTVRIVQSQFNRTSFNSG